MHFLFAHAIACFVRRIPRALPLLAAACACLSTIGASNDRAFAQEAASRADEFYARAGREVRSEHYRVLSDLDKDITSSYAKHLDLFYEEFSRRLAGIPQQAPEVPFVLMFSKERDYLDVLKTTYGINATGSGGMFFMSPRGAALAFFVEGLPRTRVFHVIQHEGFHQYAFSRFTNSLPPWVGEGLAEFFGEAVVVDGRVIVGQASPGPVRAIKTAIEQGTTVDFLRMLTMSHEQWNENVRVGSAAVQYTQAWSMVQFLGWAESGRYMRPFENYLRLLHSGMQSDRAFVQAFGTDDVASFERTWKEWARQSKPTAFGTAALRLGFLAEGLRALARDGISVTDLDDLLAKLRQRNFTVDITVHGRTATLSADDAALDIPQDELAKVKPVFELRASKPSRSSTKEKRANETHPMPPVILTRGLEPRELMLEWTRTKSLDDFEYELLSPKEAPKVPKSATPKSTTPKSAPSKSTTSKPPAPAN